MATVRVGVERIKQGTGYQVEEPGEYGVEVFQRWVEINGIRFETDQVGLLDVSYGMGRSELLRDDDGEIVTDVEGHAVRKYQNNLMGEIVIRLSSHGFETVDHREESPRSLGDAFVRGALGAE